jgi:hypothetical protein
MENAYRAHAQVSEDGTLTLREVPFAPGEQVGVILFAERAAAEEPESQPAGSHTGASSAASPNQNPGETTDALAVLESLIGTVEGPVDWAAEHDHYLYGTPKRADREG